MAPAPPATVENGRVQRRVLLLASALSLLLAAGTLQFARIPSATAETIHNPGCQGDEVGLSRLEISDTQFSPVGYWALPPSMRPSHVLPPKLPISSHPAGHPSRHLRRSYDGHVDPRAEYISVEATRCRPDLSVWIRYGGSRVDSLLVGYGTTHTARGTIGPIGPLGQGTLSAIEIVVTPTNSQQVHEFVIEPTATYVVNLEKRSSVGPSSDCSDDQIGLAGLTITNAEVEPPTTAISSGGGETFQHAATARTAGVLPIRVSIDLCRDNLAFRAWGDLLYAPTTYVYEGDPNRRFEQRNSVTPRPQAYSFSIRVVPIADYCAFPYTDCVQQPTLASVTYEVDLTVLSHVEIVEERINTHIPPGSNQTLGMWLNSVGCARVGPGEFTIADDRGTPLCENLGDPFHWLPAWRWARSTDLWSLFEDEGGILSFFSNSVQKAARGMWDSAVNAMFWMSSLLWQVTLAVLEAAVSPMGYARQFFASIGENTAFLLSETLGVAGTSAPEEAVLWSLVALAGMLAALWALYRRGPAEALRTIAGTMVPLAMMAMIVRGIQENRISGYDFRVDSVQSLGTGGIEPAAFSPSWMFEGSLHISSLISAPLVDAANAIADIEKRDAGITYCDSYAAALEDIYTYSYSIQSNEILGAPSAAAIEARGSIGKLVSRMWEQSFALTHGSAQFGSYRGARKGACLNAERQAIDRRFDGGGGVSSLEIQAVWDHTCRLQGDSPPLYGCDASRIYEIDIAQIAEGRFRPSTHDAAEVRTFFTLAMACDFVPARTADFYAQSSMSRSQWPAPPSPTGNIHNGGVFANLSNESGGADFGDGDNTPDERIVIWYDDGSRNNVPYVWVDRRWVTYGDRDVVSADRCAAWIAGNNLSAWKDDDKGRPAGTGVGAGAITTQSSGGQITNISTLPTCPAARAFRDRYGNLDYEGTACQASIAVIGDGLDSIEAPDGGPGHDYVTEAYIRDRAGRLGIPNAHVYVFVIGQGSLGGPALNLYFLGDGMPFYDLASLPAGQLTQTWRTLAQSEAFHGSAPINPQTGTNIITGIPVGNPHKIVLAHEYLQDVGDSTPSDAVRWRNKLGIAGAQLHQDEAFLNTVPSAPQAISTTTAVFDIHGYNWAHRAFQGVLALVSAIVYLMTLVGLGLGLIVANLILAGIFSVAPLLLLAMAIPHPSARKLPRKVFRLLLGALLGSAFFLAFLAFVILFVAVLGKAIDGIFALGSWGWLRSLLLAAVPIIAIKLVSGLGSQFGFKNITSLKGGMATTSGMAMAAMEPPTPRPYAYARRKYRGVRHMNRGINTTAGVLGGATGAGAANTARQRMMPLGAAGGMTSSPASAFASGAAMGSATGGMFSDGDSGGDQRGGGAPALGSDSPKFGHGSMRDQGHQLKDRLAGIGNTFRGTGDEGMLGKVGNVVRGVGQTAGLGAGLAAGAGRMARRHKKKIFAGMLLTGMLPALLPSGAILPALAAGKIGARAVRPVTERTGLARTKSQRQQETAAARQAGRDRLARVFHTPPAGPTGGEDHATLGDQGVTELPAEQQHTSQTTAPEPTESPPPKSAYQEWPEQPSHVPAEGRTAWQMQQLQDEVAAAEATAQARDAALRQEIEQIDRSGGALERRGHEAQAAHHQTQLSKEQEAMQRARQRRADLFKDAQQRSSGI